MWPKRMTVDEFAKHGFVEGSQPTVDTLKERIKRNAIPGEIQGNRYYVFVGPHNELMPPGADESSTLADLLLDEWEARGSEAA